MNFKKVPTFVIMILAFVALGAFFLPWVSVHSAPISGLTRIITGSQQSMVVDKIALYQVPIMANGPDARMMISIIKIFKPQITDADKKSWAVWGVPIFAILVAGFAAAVKEAAWKKWAHLVLGIIGCAIFIGGTIKIKTTDLDKLVLQVVMGPGLWVTLWAYLGIGLSCLYSFAFSFKKR